MQFNSSGIFGGASGITTPDGGNSINVIGTIVTRSAFKGNGSLQLSASGCTLFGDSITVGTGATDAAHRYATALLNACGNPGINYAVSGDQAADEVNNQIYPKIAPNYYGNPPTTIQIGTNDANFCGGMVATTGCQQNYFHTLLSGAAYATIPVQQQIQPQTAITGASCATTGTWTNVSVGNVAALQSIVPGSTLTCTLYNSGAQGLYVNWLATSTGTSSAGLNIDSGVITDTLNGFGFNGQSVLTHNGGTQAPFANRYALTGTGTHTFTITVSAAGSGNPFTFLWAGSPVPSTPSALANLTQAPPRIYIGGVLKMQSGGGGAPDAVTGAYDAQAQAVVSTLAGDGALAFYAPTRAYVNSITDFAGGTLPNGQVCTASLGLPVHPGNCGHQHIADAFRSVMYLPTPGVVSNALQDTAAGTGAMPSDTAGSNTAYGNSALAANTTGFGNTGVGNLVLQLNQSGSDNTAVGVQAAGKNISGSGITAVGYGAADNTTGNSNTAIGSQALFNNVSGINNVAVGQQALYQNTATNNTAVGTQALAANTSGSNNVALGTLALNAIQTSSNSTAIGTAALKLATGGSNTAVGASSQAATSMGTNNTSVGYNSLLANNTGTNNSGFGVSALAANTSGQNNVAMGVNSLLLATADDNTAIGTNTLRASTTGNHNTAVGYQAGFNSSDTTGPAFSVFLGDSATYSGSSPVSNCVAVGYLATCAAGVNNQVQIGGSTIVSAKIGNTAIPVSASAATVALTIASGTATLGTAAIASGACAASVTVAGTGVLATDAVSWAFNAAPDATYNALVVKPYVTAGNVNFLVCNPSAASITPAAATLNWRVAR
jgi:hypothetical protein